MGAVVMLGGSGFGDKMKKMKDGEKPSDESDEMDAETMAAETLLKAMKKGDAKAANKALKAWHEACYGEPLDDEESSESDDDKGDEY